jgi:hypothetical protein
MTGCAFHPEAEADMNDMNEAAAAADASACG